MLRNTINNAFDDTEVTATYYILFNIDLIFLEEFDMGGMFDIASYFYKGDSSIVLVTVLKVSPESILLFQY